MGFDYYLGWPLEVKGELFLGFGGGRELGFGVINGLGYIMGELKHRNFLYLDERDLSPE